MAARKGRPFLFIRKIIIHLFRGVEEMAVLIGLIIQRSPVRIWSPQHKTQHSANLTKALVYRGFCFYLKFRYTCSF